LNNIERPAYNQASYIKGIPLDIEGRQKLQISKTNKKRTQKNRIERVYRRIVDFSAYAYKKQVLYGCYGIPNATGKKGNG